MSESISKNHIDNKFKNCNQFPAIMADNAQESRELSDILSTFKFKLEFNGFKQAIMEERGNRFAHYVPEGSYAMGTHPNLEASSSYSPSDCAGAEATILPIHPHRLHVTFRADRKMILQPIPLNTNTGEHIDLADPRYDFFMTLNDSIIYEEIKIAPEAKAAFIDNIYASSGTYDIGMVARHSSRLE